MTETTGTNEELLDELGENLEVWRVYMGQLSGKETHVDVNAPTEFVAYWEAVRIRPDWYVDRIMPLRET